MTTTPNESLSADTLRNLLYGGRIRVQNAKRRGDQATVERCGKLVAEWEAELTRRDLATYELTDPRFDGMPLNHRSSR